MPFMTPKTSFSNLVNLGHVLLKSPTLLIIEQSNQRQRYAIEYRVLFNLPHLQNVLGGLRLLPDGHALDMRWWADGICSSIERISNGVALLLVNAHAAL